MWNAIKNFAVALAVLGGMLIVLHFLLHQLRRAGVPLAGKIDALVAGD